MREPEHVALVREAYEAMVTGGPEQLMERYDDWFSQSFEWESIVLSSFDGRAYRGKEGFARYWEEFLETFEGFEAGEASFEAVDSSRVLAVGSVRGRGAASGAPIDRPAAYVFKVEDGRICFGKSFFSSDAAREYLAGA